MFFILFYFRTASSSNGISTQKSALHQGVAEVKGLCGDGEALSRVHTLLLLLLLVGLLTEVDDAVALLLPVLFQILGQFRHHEGGGGAPADRTD